jgi:IclR family acetate operon transcriptional repressor
MGKQAFHLSEQQPRNQGEIEVLRRAFSLLEFLAGEEGGLTLAELTRRSGYPKTTVFRILRALEKLGYVTSVGDRPTFLVDGKMGGLIAASRFRLLREAARAPLRKLSEEFKETVNLGTLSKGRVYLLEVIESAQYLRMGGTAGTYEPVHSTALGKAMAAYLEAKELEQILKEHPLEAVTSRTIVGRDEFLAELKRVAQQGYALDLEENVEGACCLAVALFEADNRVAGAISVSGPLARLGAATRREVIRALQEACRSVSRSLGA